MTSRSDATIRPNGKPYRPRKPIEAVEFSTGDGDTGIAVMRTHDIEYARENYADMLAARDLTDIEAKCDWWRLVPWDAAGAGTDRSYISDPVHGTPCVVFEPEW